MTQTPEVETSRRVSRRTVVKGGIAAGTALWAVPAVQVLTATKAAAATASGGPGPSPSPSATGLSYIAMILEYQSATGGKTHTTVKINSDGSYTCGISTTEISNDESGHGRDLWDDLHDNFTTYTSGSACPAGFGVSIVGNQTTVALGGTTLVAYLVHDGGLQSVNGGSKFYAVPTSPGGAVGGYSFPSVGITGSAIFIKP